MAAEKAALKQPARARRLVFFPPLGAALAPLELAKKPAPKPVESALAELVPAERVRVFSELKKWMLRRALPLRAALPPAGVGPLLAARAPPALMG